LKYRALVGAPGEPKDFAGAQRAERSDQEDGAVAGGSKTGQQFGVPLHWKNGLFPLLDLGNYGFARHVAFENILVDGFSESRLDDVAHVVDDVIRIFR